MKQELPWVWTLNSMIRELYLGLGSNLLDRAANLNRAIELLEKELGSKCLRRSGIFESAAMGFEGPDFMNMAVVFETDLPAPELLRLCKKVERQMGRESEGIVLDKKGRRVYSSRIIDIDLLLLGNESWETEELVIPHPRMEERAFVMVPLAEILKGNS